MNVKVDYRLSPHDEAHAQHDLERREREFGKLRSETRAFTNQVVGTTGTAGILPGYTDRITQVRASRRLDHRRSRRTGPNNFFLRMRHVDLGAEHEFGRLQLDYNAGYQPDPHQSTAAATTAASASMRLTSVGWILDRTQSDLYPRFTQTEGPDFTDPANYRPATGSPTNNNVDNDHEIARSCAATCATTCPLALPRRFKTGVHWREQTWRTIAIAPAAGTIVGTAPLPSDPRSADVRRR